MNDELRPSDVPGGSKLWRIEIGARGDKALTALRDNETRHEFYIVADDQKTAFDIALRRFREELKFTYNIEELDPILVERLGKSATRETGGDHLPDSWWRRLLRP